MFAAVQAALDAEGEPTFGLAAKAPDGRGSIALIATMIPSALAQRYIMSMWDHHTTLLSGYIEENRPPRKSGDDDGG